MIIVTGGAGFIGSNLVLGLNEKGREDIIVVDAADKASIDILDDAKFIEYLDIEEFRLKIRGNKSFATDIDAVFHQGACSRTTEWDSMYMMDNNYSYSKDLYHYCQDNHIPYIYASSAAVYGTNLEFDENRKNESPVNVYGYSKYLFDEYIRKQSIHNRNQVVGLRYFNVYGPREQHKGEMASTAFHFNQQLLNQGIVKLFKGSGGYDDGEQRRDFIYVDDIVAVNIWFLENDNVSGIFNVGTGASRSFNDMASNIIKWHGRGDIEYIEFPQHLKNSYQHFTEASVGNLRNAGYKNDFTSLENGIDEYLSWLNAS